MANIDELRHEYDLLYPSYQKLIEEINSELYKKISFPIHSIKSRVKDFESFYAKVKRKSYQNPFSECTDIAGIRVICLFKEQITHISSLMKKDFFVREIVIKEKSVNEFSYESTHFIVSLKKGTSLVCEIQVRTILQESWAEIEHFLNYKQIGLEKELVRKINAISALFEIADDQFQEIYSSLETSKKKPTKKSILTPELLYHYCKKNFSYAFKNPIEFNTENISEYTKLLTICKEKGILTIKQLDELFQEKKDELFLYDQKHVKDVLNSPNQWPKLYQKVKDTGHFFSPVLLLSIMVKELYKDK